MNSEEIKKYLKYKKYILTLNEYLNIIESKQIRSVFSKNDYLYMDTDDGYFFSFKLIDK